jgi:hypothetical protein
MGVGRSGANTRIVNSSRELQATHHLKLRGSRGGRRGPPLLGTALRGLYRTEYAFLPTKRGLVVLRYDDDPSHKLKTCLIYELPEKSTESW